MLKKLNIVLITIFTTLTISYDSGFFVLIPILLFYLMKDFKNIYYTYIPAFIITLLLNTSDILELVFTLLSVIGIYFLLGLIHKKTNIKNKLFIVATSFIFVLNIIEYLIFDRSSSVILLGLTSLASSLLYIYLDMFLVTTVTKANNPYSIICIDSLLILVSILGGLNTNIFSINLGLLASSYFMMYLSRTYKNIYSCIFSIVITIIGYWMFQVEEFIFIPIISGMYLIDNIFIIIPTNALLIFSIFISNDMFETNQLISLMASTILFEIASIYVINKHKNDQETTEHIYEKIQNSTTNEILNFALFLDKFSTSFKNPKEYNERISSGIKDIVQNHCNNCPKCKDCFEKYKTNLYTIFKNILLNNEEYIDIYPEFNDYCPKISSIKRTAKMLEQTFSSIPQDAYSNNNVLLGQMNGFSNTIKKYVLDLNSKTELSYYNLMQLKKALTDYGYEITYYDISKQYENDFLITIGIKNKTYDEVKEIIETMSKSFIQTDISVILYKKQDNNIYLNIIPKLKIDVTYGYGSLSCDEVDICGDNYLVKEMKNGRFISAISDGMGNGYRAFYESDTTLKLIDDIISLNIATDTALEILNTYYSIQEYLEEYATLDFLEINRYQKKAVFYKMGATTSYIFKKNGKIDKIINKNLPFGIDEEVDMNIYDLDVGDLILMSSDGIFENVINIEDFESFINNIKNYPPQRIVYEILNYTLSHKIKTKDDMSIVALKVQQAA